MHQTVDDLLLGTLRLKGAEHPVPNNEHPGVVLVDAVGIAAYRGRGTCPCMQFACAQKALGQMSSPHLHYLCRSQRCYVMMTCKLED